jgi:hypothetical protein
MVRVSALEVRSIQDKKVYMMCVYLPYLSPSFSDLHSAFDIASPDRNRLLEIDFENALKTFSNTVHSLPAVSTSIPPTPVSTYTPPPSPSPSTLSEREVSAIAPKVISREDGIFRVPSTVVPLVESLWSVLPLALRELVPATSSHEDKARLIFALLSLPGLF